MRTRRWVRLAWGIAAADGLLCVAAIVLTITTRSTHEVIHFGFRGTGVVLGLGFAAMGALVAANRPQNPIGWLLLWASVIGSVQALTSEYAVFADLYRAGAWPGGVVASWVANWTWIPLVTAIIPLLFLLFPEGELPSRRWVPVVWVASLVTVASSVGAALLPGPLQPTGVQNPYAAGDGMKALLYGGLMVALATTATCVVNLIRRLRRAAGDAREQLRWMTFAAFIATIGLLLGAFPRSAQGPFGYASVVSVVSFLAFPAAAAIAIRHYRLYDIDLVINRAVVFGALVAFISIVYVGVVVGIGAAVGGSRGGVLPVVAAVVIAVAFQPVRERARHLANRVVYGVRATPYETLSSFSASLSDVFAAEELVPRMARLMAEGTGAVRADVYLLVGDQLVPAGSWPDQAEPAAAVPASAVAATDGGGMPGATRSVPVRHQGESLGVLAITKAPGDPMNPTEETLLAGLASQAGLVLRNARLTGELRARLEDLRASRARLVTAQDAERRRLERDIHDGAQQQLVALAVKLRMLEQLVERDPARVREVAAGLQAEAQAALEDLRDLARGIYPPLLADKGLPAALEAQARRSALAVEVEADGVARYPQEVEAAVYFCCLEALQNVAKYGQASRVRISLRAGDRSVAFSVIDDGVGFDPRVTRYGSGLTNMRDRVEALGGSLEVTSAPGAGTTVAGGVPVHGTDRADQLEGDAASV